MLPTTARRRPTRLAELLAAGRFAISVEIDPPRSIRIERTIEAARLLRDAGVDLVNISDSAMARVRMSALSVAFGIQHDLDLECLVHCTTRDRNLMALESELLGAHALGVRNIIALTGDPPRIGDYPTATGVWDVDSIGLIEILTRLNRAEDMSGGSIGQRAGFTIACALDSTAADPANEWDRLERKLEAGAHLVMTQPLYSEPQVEAMLAEARRRFGPRGIPVPVLLGVLPLVSARHAEFLHNEVPGITIPDEARAAMRAAGERGSEVGHRDGRSAPRGDGRRGRRDIHHAELRAVRAMRRARPSDPGAAPCRARCGAPARRPARGAGMTSVTPHASRRARRAPARARPDARSTGSFDRASRSRRCRASCASGSSSSTARWARCSRPTSSARPTSEASASATIRATCAATATCCVSPSRTPCVPSTTGYLEAGADIVTTNSFTATRIAQADYGFDPATVRELNVAAARLARSAADAAERDAARSAALRGRVARSDQPDRVDERRRRRPGRPQRHVGGARRGLPRIGRRPVEGGADILLIETIFDTLNAKAAIFAVQSLFDEIGERLPLIISGTIVDASGRTLSGQTVEAFWHSIRHADPLIVGLNCALGPKQLREHLDVLSRVADRPVARVPERRSAQRARRLRRDARGDGRRARRVGQARPAQRRRQLLRLDPGPCRGDRRGGRRSPPARSRSRPATPGCPGSSRSSSRRPGNAFVNVGERTNVTGSRKFARLVAEGREDEAVDIAREQVANGAQLIDVNMDEAMLDGVAAMTRFLRRIAAEPDIATVPVMVDSSKWSVIEAGLQQLQGKGVVNSISLKEGEAEFLRQARLCRRYGAAVVVMAFDEQGQAESVERRVAVLRRAYDLLTGVVGFLPEDIILDANIFAIATGMEEHNAYAVSFIEAVRQLKAAFPGSRTSGGVSNVSFAFRGNDRVREAIHSVFLYHAIAAGLDMAIVNAGVLPIYDDIEPELRERVEDVVLDRRPTRPSGCSNSPSGTPARAAWSAPPRT